MIVFNDMYSMQSQEIQNNFKIIEPTLDLVYKYLKALVISWNIESEIPLISLVYLERLLERTGTLLNKYNWKRLILTAMIISSKLWDDNSFESEQFSKVIGNISARNINSLERVFLDLIGYDLSLKGPEYAKQYFIIRTIAQYNEINTSFDDLPINQLWKFQNSSLCFNNELSKLCKDVDNLEHSI